MSPDRYIPYFPFDPYFPGRFIHLAVFHIVGSPTVLTSFTLVANAGGECR